MKKTMLTLLCLSALLLPGFNSNDPDITKAAKAVNDYFKAATAGDQDAMLKLCTKQHNDKFTSQNLAASPWYELTMLVLKEAQTEVIAGKKIDNDTIELKISVRYHDVEAFVLAHMEKAENESGTVFNEAKSLKEALPLLGKHLETLTEEDRTDYVFTINVVREKSRWLVNPFGFFI